MLTVVTGAAGFVGRAVSRRMAETGYEGRVRLADRATPPAADDRFERVGTDLTDRAALRALLSGADRVVHLAALPGGAAERDPTLSRKINLDLTLDILEILAEAPQPARLVHASSIAVFGGPLPGTIDDETVPRPDMVYGAHKYMAEIAVVDAARRGAVDGLSLRLPGIVARPRDSNGFKSAFMSDIFSAITLGDPYELPVGPDATMWMMSARRCADNLLHAATRAQPRDGPRAMTLPAIRARMKELVAAIESTSGRSAGQIRFRPDPALEAQFGSLPPLRAGRAETLGFASDGDLSSLVSAALEDLEESTR